jgi:hypothetical protein
MKTNRSSLRRHSAAALALAATLSAAPAFAQETVAPAVVTSANENPLKVTLVQDSKLRFQLEFTNPENRKVQVVIRDAQRNDLFTETFSTKGRHVRTFDLSSLADGQYSFEVLGAKDRFAQTFELATQTNRVVLAKNN